MRWVLKWAGTVAVLVTLLAMLACLYWFLVGVMVPTSAEGFWISGGAFHMTVDLREPRLMHIQLRLSAINVNSWSEVAQTWRAFALTPTYDEGAFVGTLRVPLWIPLVAFGVPTALLWQRERQRVRPTCCSKCGYDLTGNVSGRCPECGAAVEAKTGAGG
ncbi:MAG: hypothetical protein AMXMBFR47_44080 [Planctomycetota bacterium]